MAEIQEKDSGGGKKKGAKKAAVHLDMTPMVDLAFLLLTFFMLTTTFGKPQTMEINMPVKEDIPPEEQIELKASNAFTIILGEDDELYYYYGLVDDKPTVESSDYSSEGIRKELVSSRIKSNPKMTVLVKAMDKARYKNMVDILDELKITDTKKFALVEISDSDIQLVEEQHGN